MVVPFGHIFRSIPTSRVESFDSTITPARRMSLMELPRNPQEPLTNRRNIRTRCPFERNRKLVWMPTPRSICSAYVALFLLFQSALGPAIPIRNVPRLRTPIVSLDRFCDLTLRGPPVDFNWITCLRSRAGLFEHTIRVSTRTTLRAITQAFENRAKLGDMTSRGNVIPSSLGGLRSAQTYASLAHPRSVFSRLPISVLALR
jgi:hypothetical protein